MPHNNETTKQEALNFYRMDNNPVIIEEQKSNLLISEENRVVVEDYISSGKPGQRNHNSSASEKPFDWF